MTRTFVNRQRSAQITAGQPAGPNRITRGLSTAVLRTSNALSTLWQNAGRTTPVAVATDVIAKWDRLDATGGSLTASGTVTYNAASSNGGVSVGTLGALSLAAPLTFKGPYAIYALVQLPASNGNFRLGDDPITNTTLFFWNKSATTNGIVVVYRGTVRTFGTTAIGASIPALIRLRRDAENRVYMGGSSAEYLIATDDRPLTLLKLFGNSDVSYVPNSSSYIMGLAMFDHDVTVAEDTEIGAYFDGLTATGSATKPSSPINAPAF